MFSAGSPEEEKIKKTFVALFSILICVLGIEVLGLELTKDHEPVAQAAKPQLEMRQLFPFTDGSVVKTNKDTLLSQTVPLQTGEMFAVRSVFYGTAKLGIGQELIVTSVEVTNRDGHTTAWTSYQLLNNVGYVHVVQPKGYSGWVKVSDIELVP